MKKSSSGLALISSNKFLSKARGVDTRHEYNLQQLFNYNISTYNKY